MLAFEAQHRRVVHALLALPRELGMHNGFVIDASLASDDEAKNMLVRAFRRIV